MTLLFEHGIIVFMAFFAVMNPIANTAVFASLTGEMDKIQQKKVAIKSLVVTFIIIAVFASLGKIIFEIFGITLPALRIAGGILVFMIGYQMLQGVGSKLHASDSENSDISVSPLAVPLLAGPGTIATAINYSAVGSMEFFITIIAFLVLILITYVCFIFSSKIISFIGKSGLSIITRLMGLILCVIGVQMAILGVITIVKNINNAGFI